MVWVRSIPVEAVWNGAFGDTAGDDVSAICSLFTVDDEPVIHRRVGADNDVISADDVAVLRRYACWLAVLDFFGVHAGVDLSSIAKDRARETLQILERMERRLTRKEQRRSTVPETEWNAIDKLSVVYSGTVGRFELSFQIFVGLGTAQEQVSLDALELAIDVFHRGNALDAVNRRHVTLSGNARAFLAVNLFDLVETVIECGGEVRGGAARLTPPRWAVPDEADCASGAGQQVSRRHARYASADDTHVHAQVLCKRLELRHFGTGHPNRCRVA